jgi:type I restriction enzyme M protein
MTKPIRFEHFNPCVDWWGGPKREGREGNNFAWKVTADEVKARNYNLDFKNPHFVADDHGDPEELLKKLSEAEAETAKLRGQLKAILKEALLR